MRSGTDIRQARQDAGLTLREVCRRAYISPPFLSDLERGKRFATPDVLARIAAAVGLEPTAVGQQAAIDRLMESEAGRQVAQRLLEADARAIAAEALAGDALRLLSKVPGRQRQGFALSYRSWTEQVDALFASDDAKRILARGAGLEAGR